MLVVREEKRNALVLAGYYSLKCIILRWKCAGLANNNTLHHLLNAILKIHHVSHRTRWIFLSQSTVS